MPERIHIFAFTASDNVTGVSAPYVISRPLASDVFDPGGSPSEAIAAFLRTDAVARRSLAFLRTDALLRTDANARLGLDNAMRDSNVAAARIVTFFEDGTTLGLVAEREVTIR